MSLPTTDQVHRLLGKRVRVLLHKDAPYIVTEGILLGFGDGGDLELEGDDGLVYHAWPLLAIEEVK